MIFIKVLTMNKIQFCSKSLCQWQMVKTREEYLTTLFYDTKNTRISRGVYKTKITFFFVVIQRFAHPNFRVINFSRNWSVTKVKYNFAELLATVKQKCIITPSSINKKTNITFLAELRWDNLESHEWQKTEEKS